jgi:hypothetical protein
MAAWRRYHSAAARVVVKGCWRRDQQRKMLRNEEGVVEERWDVGSVRPDVVCVSWLAASRMPRHPARTIAN